MTRVRTISALAVGLVALAAPGSALAAQRFASPGGTGTTCSQPSPCSIVTAVNSAGVGDEVIVAGDQGSYGTPGSPITAQLTNANAVSVHGVAGKPMPVIYSNVSGDDALLLNNGGDQLSDLHVENLAANGTAVFIGGDADHLIARGGGEGCVPNASSTIIDSVCAGGGFGIGVSIGTSGAPTMTLRNVTAVGDSAYGISLDANGFNWVVNATNVIARGGFKDIATSESNFGSINFSADHSNYLNTQAGSGTAITAAGSGTNQTAAPVFVNAAAGDFHQAPSSPTIDHGADNALNGTTDFEGKPRMFGAHTDIGADEYAPPSVLAESASSINAQSAVLAGSVNTEGGPASARIDYGTTAAYGSSATTGAAALSASPQTLSAMIGGLAPATSYHFRIVVTNGSGTVAGSDQTFTTGRTGIRANALKKCKRKFRHNAKKRRKCRKRAKLLPV